MPVRLPDASAPLVPEAPGFREALEAFRTPPKRRALLWLGLASAAAFVAVALLDVPLRIAVLLAAVLLFHELGHWVAMRLSGQQDVRIFFIPFFGAVTTARSLPATAGARAAIALAGPVPGIVLGIVLLKLFHEPGLGRGAAVMLLYVNVLNLLPVGFLDGGRVVSALFLARLPVLEGAFSVASMVPMALLFGGKNAGGVVGGLAAGTGVAAYRRYHVALQARPLQAALAGQRDAQALSDEEARRLHAGALQVAQKIKAIKKPAHFAAVMRELFEEAIAPHPSTPERVGYGFAWAAALALGWATLAEAGVKLLS
jgi:Zn-dependent protease